MKINSRGFFKKRNEKIEDIENVIGTNGKLRRTIAQTVLTRHTKYSLYLVLLFAFLASISGTGKGITFWGVEFPPISSSALNIISTVIVYKVTRLNDNNSIILNHYFNAKDDETPHQSKTVKDTQLEVAKTNQDANDNIEKIKKDTET